MSKKKNPETTKIERTGKNDGVAHMEDGSKFEFKTDPSQFRGWGKAGTKRERGLGGFFIPDEVKAGNMMSNADRRRMGLEQDPELPDFQ